MTEKFFMHRIKEDGGTWDKGIEIHDTFEKALASYHAYLGSYAYDNPKQPTVNYVSCMITDMDGNILTGRYEAWRRPEEEESSEPEV